MQQRGTGVIDCAAALFEARFTTVTNKVVAPATANHVCLPAVAPATFCPPTPHTHTPQQAKTSIPGLGKPITAVDVTYDGRWVLATTDDYLMVVKTCFEEEGEGASWVHAQQGGRGRGGHPQPASLRRVDGASWVHACMDGAQQGRRERGHRGAKGCGGGGGEEATSPTS